MKTLTLRVDDEIAEQLVRLARGSMRSPKAEATLLLVQAIEVAASVRAQLATGAAKIDHASAALPIGDLPLPAALSLFSAIEIALGIGEILALPGER